MCREFFVKLSDVICEIPHKWPDGVRWLSAGRPQVVNLSAVVRFGRLLPNNRRLQKKPKKPN